MIGLNKLFAVKHKNTRENTTWSNLAGLLVVFLVGLYHLYRPA